MTNESAMFQGIDSLVDLEEARIWLRVMDGQRQGWRKRALEAEARLSEPRSSTAVETAEERRFNADDRCASCGLERRSKAHEKGHPFYEPVEEPVSPPSPDACETCGRDLEPEQEALANHHFMYGHPFARKPVAPPLQEGGGWTREAVFTTPEGVEYVEWVGPNGVRAHMRTAVEEAIRAKAEAGYERRAESWGYAIEHAAAENRRLQEDRDKYRTALEEISGPCSRFTTDCSKEGMTVGAEFSADRVCHPCVARRALSPSTEAPSEEK